MDITLREYLRQTDEIHSQIEKYGICIKTEDLENKIKLLKQHIKTIQSIAKRMADVSNVANEIILHRKPIGTCRQINPYPTSNDHAVLRMTDPESKIEILPDIELPVHIVSKIEHIPVSSLYYIEDLKQFAINIAGVNIKGNLANITEYQGKNTARCEYGIKCKSFINKTRCKYYHEPEDYIKLGLPVPDIQRDFTIGSWIYSKNKNPRTYFTRHVGSKDTLLLDIKMLKNIQWVEEVVTREGQLIHDLLIYMILHNKGMLERYPHWHR
jgi:hypothetical protein